MSKRKRVPTPFQRILPSVIRTFGPRLVLIVGGVVALFVFFGGSYLLSRASTPPVPPKHKVVMKLTTQAPADAQVLGASTGAPQPVQHTAATSSSTTTDMTPVNTSAQTGQSKAYTPNTSTVSHKYDLPKVIHKSQNSNDNSQGSSGAAVNVDTPLGSLSLNLP